MIYNREAIRRPKADARVKEFLFEKPEDEDDLLEPLEEE